MYRDLSKQQTRFNFEEEEEGCQKSLACMRHVNGDKEGAEKARG
jgi:hypothetical protein